MPFAAAASLFRLSHVHAALIRGTIQGRWQTRPRFESHLTRRSFTAATFAVMPTVKLIVVRHGETTANRQRIVQGQSEYPLNDLGRSQAKAAGERLSAELDTPALATAYSSDLSRAAETLDLILEAAGAQLDDVRRDPLLRERGFGERENHPVVEFVDESEANYKSQGLKAQWMYTPKGGETIEQVYQRAATFFDNLCKDIRAKLKDCQDQDDVELTILVVSHGGFIKQFLAHLASRNCQFPSKAYKEISPNTGITTINLTFQGQDMKCKEMVCTRLFDKEHLKGLGEIVTKGF